MGSYALNELTWREVRAVLEVEPRLILPVGALEQHGPHLPLGANTLIAERVTEEVSRALGILRAPAFSYGVTASSGPFAGVTGLRRKTMHRAINELFARWEDQGVREFVVITAHRFEPHLEALLMALTAEATTTVYDLYQVELGDLLESDPEVEHGGELETSLVLHLAPERVRSTHDTPDQEGGAPAPRLRGRMPRVGADVGGSVGAVDLATAQKGGLIFRRYVRTLVATLRSE